MKEHYFDAEEINMEMEVQREDFVNSFRRFLAENGVTISLNKFGKMQADLPEIKSGSTIIQHAQSFQIGDLPVNEYSI